MNKLGRGPQGDATYQIFKALRLQVLEKKNFEDGLLCSYVPTCDPRTWSILTPGASYEHTW